MSLKALVENFFIINIHPTPRRIKRIKIQGRKLNSYVHVIRIRLQIKHGTFLYFVYHMKFKINCETLF